MPPKRRQSQKSPLPGEELPPGAKRARGGHSRRTPKHSDLESMQITAPPSVTPDVLPLGQKSSLALSSSQQPLSTQQTSGLSSQQPIGSEQLSSSEHLSGNTNRGSQLVCSSHAISILADSIDFDDYKTQLYYFWGHIFLLVRNLKTKERREIFEATLPEFAQGGEERSRLETEFDACYRLFQKQFIKAVETYGHRWLNSPACQKFCELEIYARKQKRPKQVPIPSLPETGQDLLQFEECKGLEWDYRCAIDFWSLCLPAFKTRVAPAKHIGWFLADDDLSFKELSGVALELIRQFAVFELRSPGGYSLEAHSHALRTVMPAILKDSQVNLYELPKKLGISTISLPEIPAMPNYNLIPWAPDTAPYADQFDEEKTDCDISTSYLSHGILDKQDDVLFNERLKEVDTNIQRIDEGLPPADELTARESEAAAQYVKDVEDDINTMFTETLRASLDEDEDYINSDYQPPIEDLAIPQLHAPLILDGPRMTKRAEIYASGNIWARQIMAQADRALEIRRLKALLVAAQHAIALLELEEKRFQQQITELEEVNKFLSEAWQQVQERIQQNKLVQEKRDRLSQETDSLQQSRVAQETGSSAGAFFGFQGLRFRDRVGSAFTGPSTTTPTTGSDSANSRPSFQGSRTGTLSASGHGSNPVLTPVFKAHHSQAQAPASSQQSQQVSAYNVNTQAATQQPPQHQGQYSGQQIHKARSQAVPSFSSRAAQGIPTSSNRVTHISREPHLASTRPTTPSTGSYLSRLGHHRLAGSPVGGLVSSFPTFGSFDNFQTTRPGGGKVASVASSPTAHDMSPPHTPHSLPISESQRSTAYDNTSSFVPRESSIGSGDGADHCPNPSSLLGDSQQDENLAIDPESEFVDDTSLLQATVSAEQQLKESEAQNS